MAHVLGVMQGRLSVKYLGRYQAFPPEHWRAEFLIARNLGLDCIEFILDYDTITRNPLMSDRGIAEIRLLSEKTGVKVLTICADYFMVKPFFSGDKKERGTSLDILNKIIHNGSELGITDLVIPCVDQSSLQKDPAYQKQFVRELERVIPLAQAKNINLALETDLAPKAFQDLLGQLNCIRITVNYDTGNSASLGYDVREEMKAYGQRISTVHIKDRVRAGGSVALGTGDADIDLVLEQLNLYGFHGPVVLQPFRDDEGVKIFTEQLHWFRPRLERFYSMAKAK